MRKTLHELAANAEVLLSLEPEELAGIVLEILNSYTPEEANQSLSRDYFVHFQTVERFDRQYHARLLNALMEAWIWLEREGLLAPRPGHLQGQWVFVTRRGAQLKNTTDLSAYLKSNVMPKNLLHPLIAQKVWSAFIRGEWDTAVFQAFKEVEVAVREAGAFATTNYGVTLMREAFHPDKGPLSDMALPEPERVAMRELFSGAIGLLKNPHSHRKVDSQGPQGEAVEAIMLASYLMRIVDARRSQIGHEVKRPR